LADQVDDRGDSNIDGGVRSSKPELNWDHIESDLPIADLPLDAEIDLDDVESGRFVRRIIGDGGFDGIVSAFNSSI
jgi:hypothetical protein